MLNDKVWIVIPAYNEGKNISGVISQLKEITSSIVVVDDCSTDNTFEVVKNLNVNLLRHFINRGQGAALQTGTEFALRQGAEIVVHFDADGQMQVKDIVKVIEPIVENKAEVVFGSRFLNKNSQIPWTKKNFIHFPARIFNWLFTGIKLSDAHCGFRVLSKSAAEKIEITQDGMAHATEILDLVRQNNLKYQEVPVEILYHEYGQRFGSGLRIIRDLVLAKIIRK
ncbi:MAG: glycosyltransferase family 2 protein [Candidatus Parcubacteria bacterium]|nr:glycosyltransferase family 2 protein [Candidatus Parcubacteria bacterium]